MTTAFDRTVAEVTSRAVPSSGDNLLGFEIDCEQLAESHVFSDIVIRHTGENGCMLDIHLTVAAGIQTLQQVSQALREGWNSLLYSYFEASSCQWYRDGTVLRFITQIGEGAFYVTGRMIARGGPYEALVNRFLRDFGKMNGPLAAMPSA